MLEIQKGGRGSYSRKGKKGEGNGRIFKEVRGTEERGGGSEIRGSRSIVFTYNWVSRGGKSSKKTGKRELELVDNLDLQILMGCGCNVEHENQRFVGQGSEKPFGLEEPADLP